VQVLFSGERIHDHRINLLLKIKILGVVENRQVLNPIGFCSRNVHITPQCSPRALLAHRYRCAQGLAKRSAGKALSALC
jgi:hypothetical protein